MIWWKRVLKWSRRTFFLAVFVLVLGNIFIWRKLIVQTARSINQIGWQATFQEYRFNWDYLSMVQFFQYNPKLDTMYLPGPNKEQTPSHLIRARVHWNKGEFAEAISLLNDAIKHHGESENFLYWLGFSYMRLAEEKNCLAHLRMEGNHLHHFNMPIQGLLGDQDEIKKNFSLMCSLPLLMTHKQDQYSEQAIGLFTKLLENYDRDNPKYLWALNFSYMTIGEYPDSVPKQFLIENEYTNKYTARSKLNEEQALTEFSLENRSKQWSVDTHNSGKGVTAEDFDGDGFLDLVVASSYENLVFYKNNQGKNFADMSVASGLSKVGNPFLVHAVDYNGDELPDLYVTRWLQPNLLLQNKGNLSFEVVNSQVGLPQHFEPRSTWLSVWADVDMDGDLDLFEVNWAGSAMKWTSSFFQSSRLYIQEDGRFYDRTKEFGLSDVVAGESYFSASFGDYDQDGDPDLFLSANNYGSSVLLKNEGGQKFKLEQKFWAGGFGSAFVDFDHDGDLDLFRAGHNVSVESLIKNNVFNQLVDHPTGSSRILLNQGGKFNLAQNTFPGHGIQNVMGSSFGDINSDGCLDFYLGTGSPEESYIFPNLFYLSRREGNRCGKTLRNITSAFGLGSIQKGHGILFLDVDNDGDQDLYSNLGGMWPGDKWPNQLFINSSKHDYSWTKIRLRGRHKNKFGLGAQIIVVARDKENKVIQRSYHMNGKTGFGTAPLLAHIGLYTAKKIEFVKVLWPGESQWKKYPAKLNRLNILRQDNPVILGQSKKQTSRD